MNDSYAEVLVKQNRKPVHTAIQIVVLVLTAILLLAGFFLKIVILLVPGVFLLVAANFLLPLFNVEYEYLFLTGELTVDKIMGKSKRKNCFTVEMDKIELVAPQDSDRLREFANLKCTEQDYSSGREDARVYVCIFHMQSQVWKVMFEPDDKMLELMHQTSPRKIVLS